MLFHCIVFSVIGCIYTVSAGPLDPVTDAPLTDANAKYQIRETSVDRAVDAYFTQVKRMPLNIPDIRYGYLGKACDFNATNRIVNTPNYQRKWYQGVCISAESPEPCILRTQIEKCLVGVDITCCVTNTKQRYLTEEEIAAFKQANGLPGGEGSGSGSGDGGEGEDGDGGTTPYTPPEEFAWIDPLGEEGQSLQEQFIV